MRIILPILAILPTVLGCADLTASPFPEDTLQPFTAPAKYALWWKQVEACSGRRGDLALMRWYRPRDGSPIFPLKENVSGYWWSEGNRIAVRNPDDGRVVRHEMLHALLHDGEHPLEMFAGKCDGIVAYEAPEGYGASPSERLTAVTVAAESALVVTVSTNPAIPSASSNGGAFALVVTATNRLSKPVWISVSTVLVGAYYDGEDFGTGVFTTAKRILFLPGQSRRVYVDWESMESGLIRVWGTFCHVPSSVTTLSVEP